MEQLTPKKWEFLQDSHAGRRSGQQAEEKPVSWKEISHSSEELSDHLIHETDGQTVMGPWWVAPHPGHNCLDMHILAYLKTNWRDLFDPLRNVSTSKKSPCLAFYF